MAIFKRKVAGPSGSPAPPVDPRSMFSGLPAIVEHLTANRYPDGSPRQPGTVTISSRGADYTLTAVDKDVNAFLSVADPSLNDALAALDLLLADPEAQWQPSTWGARGGQGRGRKRA